MSASDQPIVLLLTRIAIALESIDAKLAKPEIAPAAEGKTPIAIARSMAKPVAKRWFEYLARDFPQIEFVEQIKWSMIREIGGSFHEKTYRHIEEILEAAKDQSQ
jgi:hypothetical protein